MKRSPLLRSCVFAVAGLAASRAYATLYTDITANKASIDSSGDVVENGTTFLTVYKPVPPTSNIHAPAVSTNGGYTSNDSLAYEIDPSPSGDTSSTDKVDTRVSHADDSTGLGFDSVKYLGFALNIPALNFSAQTSAGDTGVQIAQWWQGSPYTPPLALDLTGTSNGMAAFELIVHNDTTLGNPSSIPVVLLTGTIPFDAWNTFVIETNMDYSGNGEVALWENGTKLVDKTNLAVGYDPTTIPYKNPPQGTANPNSKFDVFIGPYRTIQPTQQQENFDDVRWANTLADATPVPQAQVVLSSTSALSVVSDGDIGGSLASGLSFSGGQLSVTSSFISSRAITIAATGGTVDVAHGVTFGLTGPLTWSGGTLHTTDTGTLAIAQTSGAVSVTTGSTLNIGTGSTVSVGGSIDPFTDFNNSSAHVAIINNGNLTVAGVSSTIAGITGAGSLVVGDGSVRNTLHLATGSGASSVNSLTILGTSALDLGNNHLFINYGSGADPLASVIGYIKSAYDGGLWDGPGITSSAAQGNPNYGIGFADSADPGNPAGLASGQIEVKYTLLGDANLDGAVNGSDFAILATNFNKAVGGWDAGDFNYDGAANGADFAVLAANFNKGASNTAVVSADLASVDSFAAANGLMADVPEPTCDAIAIMAFVGAVAKRRRFRQN